MFFEEVLFLQSACNLKCLSCDACLSDKRAALDFSDIIQKGRFFDYYTNTKGYNIVGGNPLLHEQLGDIIHFLKHEHKVVRVWTNAAARLDLIRDYRQFVDEWMILFPATDPQLYQENTGLHQLSDCDSFLNDLKDSGIPFRLHTKVTEANVADMPELIDYCADNGFSLLLHYDRSMFQKPLAKRIQYFSVYSYVTVVSVASYSNNDSCFVPVYDANFALKCRWNHLYSKIRRMTDSFRL